ncbi:MAG: hypothetical protein U0575_05780 [Phycisphaerales bacterium]
MALPLQANASASTDARRESVSHQLAHALVAFFRPVFLIFLTATIVLMATIWPLAVATGLIAILAGGVVWIAGRVEDHTEAGASGVARRVAAEALDGGRTRPRADDDGAESAMEAFDDQPVIPGGSLDDRIVWRETRTIGGIAIGLALLAVVIGLSLFQWPMLALGIGIVLMYMALVTFPAWAAWIEGDVEATTEAARHQDA